VSNKDRWGRCYAPDKVVDFPAYQGGGGGCCPGGGPCGPQPTSSWTHDFTDQRANKSCTVLVEVTDACNLACRVCYSDSRGDRMLPLPAFQTYVGALVAQKGPLD